MIRPITTITTIHEKIVKFASKSQYTRALLRFGSYLEGTADLQSDLDFFFLVSDAKKFREELAELEFVHGVHYDHRSVIFFKGEGSLDLRKVDLGISEDLEQYFRMLKTTDDPGGAVLVDKCGIRERVMTYRVEVRPNELVSYHVNRFMEAYYNMCASSSVGDRYRFLFHQTIALQHLYTLEYMAHGHIDYSYLPKQLTTSIDREVYDTLREGFDPVSRNDMRAEVVVKLHEKMTRTLDRVLERYPGSADKAVVNGFIQETRDSFIIKNIRDIADVAPDRIKDDVVFRAAALPFYSMRYVPSSLVFQTIIDLRNDEERSKFPYDLAGSGITYHVVSIGPKHVDHDLKYSVIGIDPYYYEYFPRYYGEEIAEVMRSIMEMPKPVVLHCHSGKDRTGMIVALIQMLAGIPRELIVLDYLSSRSDTRREKLEIMFKVIDEFGGIRPYLARIGMGEQEIQQLSALIRR